MLCEFGNNILLPIDEHDSSINWIKIKITVSYILFFTCDVMIINYFI